MRKILQEQTLDTIHKYFPPLSRKQLEICIFHTFGVAKSNIANSYNISVEAVKQNIQRSVHKLGLENSDALRTAILAIIFVIMINK